MSEIVNRELKLHSPAGVEPAVFTWPNAEQKSRKDAFFIGGDEIVRTIRLVFEDYPELYQANLGLDNCDIHSYSKMKELCDKFNKIVDTHVKLNRGTEAFSARLKERTTSKLFRHILAQIYSRAVTDPEKLRDYQPFSPSVYGETSPDLVDSILKVINLTDEQTFIDLGSGVGNVVLHVAALSNCKYVYGIELEEIPAKYARAMADEFRFWMRWYGKHFSDFDLEQGDFLIHPTIDEKIREADVIFANNYVFGAKVDHELKIKFMDLKDGAKIVSSKEFCPETFRLNDRTKNDLGAVLNVSKPEEFLGKVSWSDKCVQYYLHVVDHSKLAHYFEKTHQNHIRGIKAKHNDDENSQSSSHSIKLNKLDENHPPNNDSKVVNGKRKTHSPTPTSSSNPPILISGRGRKIHVKRQSFNESELESDISNDDSSTSKARRTCRDYKPTLNELHDASEKFIRSSQSNRIDNDRYNYQNMTKLTNENLDIKYFRNCLFEQEDHHFLNAINSYLEQFRQRLLSYFTYMKSDIYKEHLRKQLDNEMELNKTLKAKVNCLESNIKALLEDAIRLLKLRTNELGIEDLERPVQLISYANDISNKHKELRSKVATLEKEISEYDHDNEKINLILNSVQTNRQQLTKPIANDNTYSTLLVNISRQTQQQDNKLIVDNREHSDISPCQNSQRIQLSISPNSSTNDKKIDFIIQKRAKKIPNQNSEHITTVSPIKIIKVTDKYFDSQQSSNQNAASSSSSTVVNNINNILSTKQLEPLQVHSVAAKVELKRKQETRLQQPVVQSININSPSSSSSVKQSSNKLSDVGKDKTLECPRKKRDFYGKSSDSSTDSSTSTNRSHRHSSKTDSSSSKHNRIPSIPTSTETSSIKNVPDSIVLKTIEKTSSSIS